MGRFWVYKERLPTLRAGVGLTWLLTLKPFPEGLIEMVRNWNFQRPP